MFRICCIKTRSCFHKCGVLLSHIQVELDPRYHCRTATGDLPILQTLYFSCWWCNLLHVLREQRENDPNDHLTHRFQLDIRFDATVTKRKSRIDTVSVYFLKFLRLNGETVVAKNTTTRISITTRRTLLKMHLKISYKRQRQWCPWWHQWHTKPKHENK